MWLNRTRGNVVRVYSILSFAAFPWWQYTVYPRLAEYLFAQGHKEAEF